APIYAREMERLGHAHLPDNVAPDDPAYLDLINAQVAWLRANSSVADIYSIRRTADGRHILLVDSETDYDGNGFFEGPVEARTVPGEELFADYDLISSAFAGRQGFADVPASDRWGTWISAYAPMFGPT